MSPTLQDPRQYHMPTNFYKISRQISESAGVYLITHYHFQFYSLLHCRALSLISSVYVPTNLSPVALLSAIKMSAALAK